MAETYPEGFKYSKEHEWVENLGDAKVRIGITFFAQDELGDVVFVEMPEVGDEIEADTPFTVVESVKAVSDVYAPVSGKILEVNQEIADRPELINEEPYGAGWIVVVEMTDATQLAQLLSAEEYRAHVEAEDA